MDILWGGGRKQDEDYGSSKSDFCIFLAPKQGFEFPALSSSLCVLLWGRVVWPQIIFTQCWVSYVIDVDNHPWKSIVLTKIFHDQKTSQPKLILTFTSPYQKIFQTKIILIGNNLDQKLSYPKIVWNKNWPDQKLSQPKVVLSKNYTDQKLFQPKICLSKHLLIQKSYWLKIHPTKNHPDRTSSQQLFVRMLCGLVDFWLKRYFLSVIFLISVL